MELRDYQLTAIEQVREKLRLGKKRVCLCLPTGAGKTVIFSSIANSSIEKGKKVLICVHRTELKKQAEKSTTADIYMVETLNNLIKKNEFDLNNYDLVIIDEVHIGNFRKVLESYTGYTIGCTATPISSNKDFPLKTLFEDIVNPISIAELIENNRLSKPRTFARVPVNLSDLKKVCGEYSEKSQNLVFNSLVVYNGLVDDYINNCNNKKAIIFCCSIDHAINVYNTFISKGVNAFLVHSKLKERDNIIKAYFDSIDGVMVNCGILTTGFDEPNIEVVMINRATASISLWLQMVGRGSRTTPYKNEFFIYDYGENYKRLGMWEDYRDWKTIFFQDKKKKEGIAPTKMCPKCGFINKAMIVECENSDCNHIFESTKKEIAKSELQEIILNKAIGKKLFSLSKNEILALAEKKKWKLMYVERLIYHIFGIQELNKFFDEKQRKTYYRELRLKTYSNELPPFNYIIK